jgi:putative peptidoglycan lipid II flippase
VVTPVLKKESFLESLATSAVWRGGEAVLALVKHVAIAGMIGLSATLDVFYMALGLMGITVYSLGALLETLAVPRLTALWKNDDREGFGRLAGGMLSLAMLLGLGLAALAVVGREPLSQLAVGFDAARKAGLAESFLWLAPVVVFYLPFRLLGSMYRATRQFSTFSQMEFLLTAVGLGLLLAFPRHPQVLFLSFSGGITVAFTILFVRTLGWAGLRAQPFAPAVIASLAAAPWLLLVQFGGSLNQLVYRLFASYLPERAVGALSYGSVLAGLVPSMLLFGNAFMTVIAERREAGETGAPELNDLISLALLVAIPASVFLVLFGDGLVRLLLERGVFDARDTALVAQALAGYAPGILATLLGGPVQQIFQLLGRNDVLLIRVGVGLLLGLGLNALFVFALGWGVGGVATAMAISSLVTLGLSLSFLHGQGITLAVRRHLAWLAYLGLVAGLAAALAKGGAALAPGAWAFPLAALAFGAVIAAAVWAAPGHEGGLIRGTLRRALRRA